MGDVGSIKSLSLPAWRLFLWYILDKTKQNICDIFSTGIPDASVFTHRKMLRSLVLLAGAAVAAAFAPASMPMRATTRGEFREMDVGAWVLCLPLGCAGGPVRPGKQGVVSVNLGSVCGGCGGRRGCRDM